MNVQSIIGSKGFEVATIRQAATLAEAVARHDWSGALTIGELITTDYPNTRMAEEVRELLPGIRWRVDPSGQPPPGDGSSGEVAATPGSD